MQGSAVLAPAVLASSVLVDNLLSPPIVAFVVAVLATLARFEVRLPESLPPILSFFLLLSIGVKGGRSLFSGPPSALAAGLAAALVVGVVTPLIAFAVMRTARLGRTDAAALAAHYGSVSAVTFVVVLATLDARGITAEGFTAALVAVLEVIGIVVGLALAERGRIDGARSGWAGVLAEVARGRSVTPLLVGLVIGASVGDARLVGTDPLFVGLFTGALTLFLLEMGAVAAGRLRAVARAGWRLAAAAVLIPVVNGSLGALIGAAAGLSTGGVAVLATLAASASYIAAPAAVRIALPEADPGLSITASLGITFPFNLTLGIPFYVWLAGVLT
jgi:uncharacterized protein